MTRPVDRFVDSLLRRRRPKSFTPTPDDIAVARTAIALAAAAPDADQPREAFIAGLRQRVTTTAVAPAPRVVQVGRATPGRRRFLQATALTATGAAVALGAEQLVGDLSSGQDTPSQATISPLNGAWQTVTTDERLATGAVVAFDTGGIVGFVHRDGGHLTAVSGVCTHQACKLDLTQRRDALRCPCHGATFALSGRTLSHPYRVNTDLPALPRLPVRLHEGDIQIYAPRPMTNT